MTAGIFRGTCEKYFHSELWFPEGDLVCYSPTGDFAFHLGDALSWAYKKALETDSNPIVACLLNRDYIGNTTIPLSNVMFVVPTDKPSLEILIKLHDENKDIIPFFHRIQYPEQYDSFLESYLKEKAKKESSS